MRTWQNMGFNSYTSNLLSKTKHYRWECTEQKYTTSETQIEDPGDPEYSSWKSNPDIYRYIFDNGQIYESFIQSSGPVTFMALKDTSTGLPIPESLWTKEEIENNM